MARFIRIGYTTVIPKHNIIKIWKEETLFTSKPQLAIHYFEYGNCLHDLKLQLIYPKYRTKRITFESSMTRDRIHDDLKRYMSNDLTTILKYDDLL
jgi:hypothetical protein